MKVYTEHFPHMGGPFAVCIGKFDGLHVGHRRILETLLDVARVHSAASVVYSFESSGDAPRLSTIEEKNELFMELGIDIWIQAELTGEFMAQPPELFIERLAACGELKAVAVGRDFRFGRGAAGNAVLLEKLGETQGFLVCAVEQVKLEGRIVSSTWIRECVVSGDAARAARLLGREYSLSGEVVRGRQLGGKLGFRTANILPPKGKLLPADGVYAAYADTENGTWPAMTNIGVKPTVGGGERTVESHLLGLEGDLYGERITIRLVSKVRDEIKFDNLYKLTEQLEADRATVRNILCP
jgi:riboflavin kinase/FMN adenylyltransferase